MAGQGETEGRESWRLAAGVSHTYRLSPMLQEYQSKLEKSTAVREELKSHIASLPDLSSFPLTGSSSTEGLAPLPSVGDLFS